MVFEDVLEHLKRAMFMLSDQAAKYKMETVRDETGVEQKRPVVEGTVGVESFLMTGKDILVRSGKKGKTETAHTLVDPSIMPQLQNAFNYMHMAFRTLTQYKAKARDLGVEGLFQMISIVLSSIQKAQKELVIFPEAAFPTNPYRTPIFSPPLPLSVQIDFNIVEADLLISVYILETKEAAPPARGSIKASSSFPRIGVLAAPDNDGDGPLASRDSVPPSPDRGVREGSATPRGPGGRTFEAFKMAASTVAAVGHHVGQAASTAGAAVTKVVGSGVDLAGRLGLGKTKERSEQPVRMERTVTGTVFTFEGVTYEIVQHYQARHTMPMIKSALTSLEKAMLQCASIRTKTMVHSWIL